jgi:hypothetical protein
MPIVINAFISYTLPPSSFDHLVGAGEQRWGHSEAECLGRFKIDANSNLVDCCTGRSAGFSPVTIRPV